METQNKNKSPYDHPVIEQKKILTKLKNKVASSIKGAVLFFIRLLILIFGIITLVNLIIALYLNSLDGRITNKKPKRVKPIIINR